MNKGKARTTMPRTSDAAPFNTAREPDGTRDAQGRFQPGNDIARDRGVKMVIGRMVGRLTSEELGPLSPESEAIKEDTWRLLCASIRELGNPGSYVRRLLAHYAWHDTMAAFWRARELAVGPCTPEGIAADDRATEHDKRAERLSVTAQSIARAMLKSRPEAKQRWPGMVDDDESEEPIPPTLPSATSPEVGTHEEPCRVSIATPSANGAEDGAT